MFVGHIWNTRRIKCVEIFIFHYRSFCHLQLLMSLWNISEYQREYKRWQSREKWPNRAFSSRNLTNARPMAQVSHETAFGEYHFTNHYMICIANLLTGAVALKNNVFLYPARIHVNLWPSWVEKWDGYVTNNNALGAPCMCMCVTYPTGNTPCGETRDMGKTWWLRFDGLPFNCYGPSSETQSVELCFRSINQGWVVWDHFLGLVPPWKLSVWSHLRRMGHTGSLQTKQNNRNIFF